MSLKDLDRWGEEIERRVRLKTFPLAIKMLQKETEIPEGAVRPLRDYGNTILAAQGFAASRREGTVVAQLKEDMGCCEPVIGYGLSERPEYFAEGNNRFPRDVETQEAGANYASDFPRFEVGKYIGILSAPLSKANFEPDLVMIYCNSAQLQLLLLAREYRPGHHLNCNLSSHAACVYGIVPPMQTGECQVAIPCRGDRWAAIAGDEEIILTVPVAKMEELMAGLRHLETTGSKLPHNYSMAGFPHEMPPSYQKIAAMLGMTPPQ